MTMVAYIRRLLWFPPGCCMPFEAFQSLDGYHDPPLTGIGALVYNRQCETSLRTCDMRKSGAVRESVKSVFNALSFSSL
jgi:hypothetical protein